MQVKNQTMTIQEVIDALEQSKDKSQLCYIWCPDDLIVGQDRYPISLVDTSMDRHVDINAKNWSDRIVPKYVNQTLNNMVEYPEAVSVKVTLGKNSNEPIKFNYELMDKHNNTMAVFTDTIEVLGDLIGLKLCEVFEHNPDFLILAAPEGKATIWE